MLRCTILYILYHARIAEHKCEKNELWRVCACLPCTGASTLHGTSDSAWQCSKCTSLARYTGKHKSPFIFFTWVRVCVCLYPSLVKFVCTTVTTIALQLKLINALFYLFHWRYYWWGHLLFFVNAVFESCATQLHSVPVNCTVQDTNFCLPCNPWVHSTLHCAPWEHSALVHQNTSALSRHWCAGKLHRVGTNITIHNFYN